MMNIWSIIGYILIMCYVFIKLAEIILCTKSETIDQGQVKPLISLTKFKMIKKGISKCHYYVSI